MERDRPAGQNDGLRASAGRAVESADLQRHIATGRCSLHGIPKAGIGTPSARRRHPCGILGRIVFARAGAVDLRRRAMAVARRLKIRRAGGEPERDPPPLGGGGVVPEDLGGDDVRREMRAGERIHDLHGCRIGRRGAQTQRGPRHRPAPCLYPTPHHRPRPSPFRPCHGLPREATAKPCGLVTPAALGHVRQRKRGVGCKGLFHWLPVCLPRD